ARAFVGDVDDEVILLAAQRQGRLWHAGVPGDVEQQLAHHLEDDLAQIGVVDGEVAGRLQVNVQPVLLADVLAQPAQRIDQPFMRNGWRAQLHAQPAVVLNQLVDEAADKLGAHAGFRQLAQGAGLAQDVDVNLQGVELLLDVVVQDAGNTPSLALFGQGQVGGELARLGGTRPHLRLQVLFQPLLFGDFHDDDVDAHNLPVAVKNGEVAPQPGAGLRRVGRAGGLQLGADYRLSGGDDGLPAGHSPLADGAWHQLVHAPAQHLLDGEAAEGGEPLVHAGVAVLEVGEGEADRGGRVDGLQMRSEE